MMAEPTDRADKTPWISHLGPWLLVGGLVLFHAVNNWLWLVENVTSTGWDKPRHLAHSLSYTQMLSPPTVRSLFTVMTADPIRPPLFPASAAPFYWLFGRSADAAVMVNIIYMAIVLAATYGLGRRWGGRRQGMVSVVLLAAFPMFYSMSRFFYLEFALTAMVALTVYLLSAADGFERQWVSLLFGLCLGLGLLTKRTFALFAVGPVIAVILSSGLLPAAWQRLKRRPHLYWRNLLFASTGGLALAAFWYFPNREAVQTLVLGDTLFLLWWGLAAAAIYFAILPSAPLSNALAAFFLAAGLASTWYLGRIEFLERVGLYAYGIDDPRGRVLQLDKLYTYTFYLRKLSSEHVSLAIFVLLVGAILAAVVVSLRRQGSVRRFLQSIRQEGWVVLTWLGGAYFVLTFSIYHETRAIVPALPAVALLFASALFKLPWRRFRIGLLVLVLAFGFVQFFAVSYEPVSRLLPTGSVLSPLWGRISLFAQGDFIQLPDEGDTDSGYWIEPDVLGRMEERRVALGEERQTAGLLVNTSQINAGAFDYLVLTEYPHLRVEGLIGGLNETPPYNRLFAHDFVVVKRTNADMNASQKDVIDAILGGPPQLFSAAFELDSTYPLPDGDTVYVYRQRHHLPDDYPVGYVVSLANQLAGTTRAGDAIILNPAELAALFLSEYAGQAGIYVAPSTEAELGRISALHRRVYLVLGDAEAGEVLELPEQWLDLHGFRAAHEWAGSMQLVTYGTVDGEPALAPTARASVSLGDKVGLAGHDVPAGAWQPGDVVPLTLFWKQLTTLEKDYTVFVHLLDGSGKVVAQNDSAPAGGSRPTSGWNGGEEIVDRHGLLLPDDLPPGEYVLSVGMYLPATGVRLEVTDPAADLPPDRITLGTVVVAHP
jgi:4-amino-4-deoxy-L-arabinose transferase-like glycosyltransferase